GSPLLRPRPLLHDGLPISANTRAEAVICAPRSIAFTTTIIQTLSRLSREGEGRGPRNEEKDTLEQKGGNESPRVVVFGYTHGCRDRKSTGLNSSHVQNSNH